MKNSELNLKKEGFKSSCYTYKSGMHYKFMVSIGRCFPTTKAQAKYFLAKGIYLDVLNGDDVELIEGLLNKHGFEGDYKPTKSGRWVRLQNNDDLRKALKLEFNI